MYLPMQSMQHEHTEVKYLQEATLIFQEWRQAGKPGLKTETFTACIQSMTAIPELAKSLLERHGFHNVESYRRRFMLFKVLNVKLKFSSVSKPESCMTLPNIS